MSAPKGEEREKSLSKDRYFSREYFSIEELMSLALQIRKIYEMQPRSILEIGPGNGFVSSFFKRAGYDVVTLDINPDLGPDICASISEMDQHITRQFDLVVCCEVLEHMPLDMLDQSLDQIRTAGDRLFLTLPNSFTTLGFGIVWRIPKLGSYLTDFNINMPRRHRIDSSPHFWEVGYSRECTKKEILRKLGSRYGNVKSGRFALNPYHLFFSAG